MIATRNREVPRARHTLPEEWRKPIPSPPPGRWRDVAIVAIVFVWLAVMAVGLAGWVK